MTTSPRLAHWPLALVAALALAGCGKEQEADTTPTPPADPGVRSPASPMTVQHILVGSTNPRLQVKRSKETALARAQGIVSEARSGRRTFDDLVLEYTDDRDQAGQPNAGNQINRADRTKYPPGTYVFNELSGFAPPFTEASKKLRPGEISEPVDTEFGYHVIKRIK